MSIRILVGTEPGSDFKHAILWNSTTDVAFGPVFYESGRPHFLDPGDVAEAFGKWVGWGQVAAMDNADLSAKKSEMEALLRRDPKEAEAEGVAAGKLAVANGFRAPLGEDYPARDALDETRDDEWGRLSTDGAHPWAIVLDQEQAWAKGFAFGFQFALAGAK